jgi:uncharacterized protein (DUF2345 family)
MPSPFDISWGSANSSIDATAGEWITVNGMDIRGVVSTLETSSRGQPGALIADNRTQIDISADDAILVSAVKGKIVIAKGKRLRIMAAHDNGAVGVTLICEGEEQSTTKW